MPADRTPYNKLTWINDQTKLNATNLNHLEDGVAVNNLLSIENANYIDEIYDALINRISFTYDHNERTLTVAIGDSEHDSRFFKTATFDVTGNFYDKTEVETRLATKQNQLESGTNIKTIAGSSLLGSGNISFDSSLNGTSTNAPQTKVVKEALDSKLDKTDESYALYGTDENSTGKTYSVDQDNSYGDVPLRNANGGIKVPTPSNSTDAANKAFVESYHDSTKQNVLTFDSTPTANSTNPVTSGGVKTELDKKQDKLTAGSGISIAPDGTISYSGVAFSMSVVNSLPLAGTANTFYFVPAVDSETNNEFEEYVYVNNKWELVGKTSIDLSNFYTKQEVDTALALKQNTLVSGTDVKTINSQSILGSGNINIEAGAKKITGAELEDMEYVQGQLYYCTSNSDSFSIDTLYLAKSAASIYPISTGSAISTSPAITSFSVSPTTTEYGNTQTVSYSYTLKKYSSIENVKLDGVIINATPSQASNSGTASAAYDVHTFSLTAETNGETTLSKTASISALYRQFYGVMAGNDTAAILANLKNITSNSNNLKTYLQNSLPSSVSLALGDTPVYVYLIVKSNLSINTLKSGGFDVPFSLIETKSFTNNYDASYDVKIYRTDNKVFGDMVMNINS